MNSLSWLIYLSDVLPNLATVFLVVALIITAVVTVGAPIFFDEDFNHIPRKTIILIGFLCALVASVLPSQRTILLIAASEIGEKTLDTEVGQQAIRILRNKLSEIELEQTRKTTK